MRGPLYCRISVHTRRVHARLRLLPRRELYVRAMMGAGAGTKSSCLRIDRLCGSLCLPGGLEVRRSCQDQPPKAGGNGICLSDWSLSTLCPRWIGRSTNYKPADPRYINSLQSAKPMLSHVTLSRTGKILRLPGLHSGPIRYPR